MGASRSPGRKSEESSATASYTVQRAFPAGSHRKGKLSQITRVQLRHLNDLSDHPIDLIRGGRQEAGD